MIDSGLDHGRLKFSKEERLHHRSLVEGLFKTGKSFYEFPFRVTWRVLSNEQLKKNFRNEVPQGIGCVQMMVTVPKKKRRKAVDRVLMRRRIREAYRLNRNSLKQQIADYPLISTLSIAFVYIHDRSMSYQSLEGRMRSVLDKLSSKIISETKTEACQEY